MEMFLTDAARAGHLIGLATGFGLALAADLLALRSLVHPVSHRDVWLLGWLHRLILGGLALLWVSGLLLLQHRTGFDPALFTPKLICKLAVVSLLTLNALLIGVYVLPRYTANAGRRFGDFDLVPRLNLSLVAGVSMSCWTSALVLGVFSQLKTLSFAQLENILGPMFLLGLGAALAVGGGAALMLRTPTFRVIAMRHVDPDEIRRAA